MRYEELVPLLVDRRKATHTMDEMAQLTGLTRQSLSSFENLKSMSDRALLSYLSILCTSDEIGDIITNLDTPIYHGK